MISFFLHLFRSVFSQCPGDVKKNPGVIASLRVVLDKPSVSDATNRLFVGAHDTGAPSPPRRDQLPLRDQLPAASCCFQNKASIQGSSRRQGIEYHWNSLQDPSLFKINPYLIRPFSSEGPPQTTSTAVRR